MNTLSFIYENTFKVYIGMIALVVTVVAIIAWISHIRNKDK